ncbi:hypothetical protein EDC65_1969 [Stella humosa]|uniref:Uncharacterized protein n=1 Tax=Stella humosa TaxID=94 RepID=A0A3N1M8Y5_9PROT|nr:hypothetical protein [Stella humosa]ROQ00173.1 hypothetical protein EDC65_1969 [Stella humosa]BBK30593.1 hypothetical protein STHU_12270 [Stella humosa]
MQIERTRAGREPEVTHADLLARIAVLEIQIGHLRETIQAGAAERARILAELTELKLLVAQIRGAWRVVGAACGAVGMVMGALLPTLFRTIIGG